MAVSWSVIDTRCVLNLDGNTKVIDLIFYQATDRDDDGNTGSVSGQQSLDTSNITDFIPYPDVTEQVCLTWLFDAMGADAKAEVEANVAAQISEKAGATEANGLPWQAESQH